jgi:hypothetical protein
MRTAVHPLPAFSHRLKALMVVAMLLLALGAGAFGTTTPVSAAKRQPQVACTYYTRELWIVLTNARDGTPEDPGPGGYWDCNFV